MYNMTPRGRFNSMVDNFSEMADGVAKANKAGGFLDAGRFMDQFDWSNINLGEADIGRSFDLVKNADTGVYEIFRKGEKIDEIAVQKAMREGDLMVTIREMKFDNIPGEVEAYAKNYKRDFQNSAGYKAGKEMDNYKPSSRPNPGTEVGFLEQIQADPKLNAKMKQVLDNLASKVSDGRLEVGKWLKRTIVVAVGTLSLAWLYNKVIEHQKLMNGCWLVNLLGPAEKVDRCKISTLSCDDVDKDSQEVQQYMCSDQAINQCGGADKTPCFSPGECIKFDVDNNCIETLGAPCAEGTCHPACSPTANVVEVPPNYRLVCVHLNFWDSVEDFVDEVIDQGKSTLTWILQIVVLGLIAVFLFNYLQNQSKK